MTSYPGQKCVRKEQRITDMYKERFQFTSRSINSKKKLKCCLIIQIFCFHFFKRQTTSWIDWMRSKLNPCVIWRMGGILTPGWSSFCPGCNRQAGRGRKRSWLGRSGSVGLLSCPACEGSKRNTHAYTRRVTHAHTHTYIRTYKITKCKEQTHIHRRNTHKYPCMCKVWVQVHTHMHTHIHTHTRQDTDESVTVWSNSSS